MLSRVFPQKINPLRVLWVGQIQVTKKRKILRKNQPLVRQFSKARSQHKWKNKKEK